MIKNKILAILEAGDVYPSGYIRSLIYKDFFMKNGFKIKYASRLCIGLLRLEIKVKKIFPAVLSAIFARFIALLQEPISYFKTIYLSSISKRYDIIFMSKIKRYGFIKRIRKKANSKLVYDFGDAIWLQKGVDLPRILRTVDSVITDNEYAASYVKRYNKNCAVIPDSPQVEEFDKKRSDIVKKDTKSIIIGWIGTPSSFSNFYLLHEPLERLFSKYPDLHLRLVGVGYNTKLLPRFKNVNYSTLPYYSQSEMIREVLSMDIGVFPLCDNEASRVRGILKATVYMSGEVACICSAIGQCRDLIKDKVNGMLAKDSEEWEQKLELLITNPELRKRIAKNGLETVRRNFSLEDNFKKLLDILK